MNYTGRVCEADRCPGDGVEEYCGFCGYHWADLSGDQRKALPEDRIPIEPAPIHQHHHETVVRHPPQSRWVTVLLALLSGAAGAALVLWLAGALK